MPVTRSWAEEAAPLAVATPRGPVRRGGVLWLMASSLFVAAGLAMVFAAKMQSFNTAQQLVNINSVETASADAPDRC